MSVKIGINGFGRIGRNYLRAALAQGSKLDIVAVNDLSDTKSLATLLKFDSVMGRINADISFDESNVIVNGTKIKVLAERDPALLPWGDLGVDIVIESTGRFTNAKDAQKHIDFALSSPFGGGRPGRNKRKANAAKKARKAAKENKDEEAEEEEEE